MTGCESSHPTLIGMVLVVHSTLGRVRFRSGGFFRTRMVFARGSAAWAWEEAMSFFGTVRRARPLVGAAALGFPLFFWATAGNASAAVGSAGLMDGGSVR